MCQLLAWALLIIVILAAITIPYIVYVRPGFFEFWEGWAKGWKGERKPQ